MKNKYILVFIFITTLTLFFFVACNEDIDIANDRELPVAVTLEITDITETSAKSGGVIESDGGLIIRSKGVCWGTSENPTVDDNVTKNGAGNGAFESHISGLTPNTKYYLRAYATNAAGTNYGETIEFNTLEVSFKPTVQTLPAEGLTFHSANLSGEISDQGNTTITERGFYYGTSVDVHHTGTKIVVTDDVNTFSAIIGGLQETTTYYYRAFATNKNGEAVGAELTMKTYGLPVVISKEPRSVTNITAIIEGAVSNNGGHPITERGFYYGKNIAVEDSGTKQTVEGEIGNFSAMLSNLSEYTVYYYKAFATNTEGTRFGELKRFHTGGSVTDIDNNMYHSLILGNNQEWLAQNLTATKYRNGDPILTDQTNVQWENLTAGAYAVYPYSGPDATNINSVAKMVEHYGLLYNWHAVTDTRGLCPIGWRVPSKSDWEILRDYIGSTNAGGKLKSTRVQPDDHPRWLFPNDLASDNIGFSGHPSGLRANHGVYDELGKQAYWWTKITSADSPSSAHFVRVSQRSGFLIFGIQNKKNGYSVRCIRE